MDSARHDFASPRQIPLAVWRTILARVCRRMMVDNLGVLAGGVAFYGFLAVFPAIVGAMMVWGLVFGTEVSTHLGALRELAPGPATDLFADQMARIASRGDQELTLGAILTIVFALWSASRGMTALMGAMNMAYHEKEKRGFLRLNALAIGFTLAGIAFVSLSLTAIAAAPPILKSLFLGAMAEAAIHLVRWLFLISIFMLASAMLYRFGPSRQKARWTWIVPGAAAAALVWLIASLAFSLYIANFNAYSVTFGPLGAVAALLMWFWLSAYAVCMGAELNSQLELFTTEDTTIGPQHAPGQRGAFVADHVEAPRRASTTFDRDDVKIPKEAERNAAETLALTASRRR